MWSFREPGFGAEVPNAEKRLQWLSQVDLQDNAGHPILMISTLLAMQSSFAYFHCRSATSEILGSFQSARVGVT